MTKLAGVVILYNPEQNVSMNIYSYLDQVDRLYIIDNSNVESEFIKKEFVNTKKVVYLPNKRNLGIAKALNLALDISDRDEYQFLLTMDQDSYFQSKVLDKMLPKIREQENLAIISCRHHYLLGKKEEEKAPNPIDNLVAMTSGNIVRVKVLKSIGGYMDDLFIDYVDHEICLRLNRLGYKVEIMNDYKVIHALGDVKEKKILWKKIYPTNHSYIRHYYKTRNRLFVYKTYGRFFPEYLRIEIKNFVNDILKVIFFEEQRCKKLKFIFFGYRDYKNKNFGQCTRV